MTLFFLNLFQNFLPPKIQEMILDRDQKNFQNLNSRPIWIHASSGEIEYAKSLVRKLKTELPQVPIMVTFFSPSAKKLISRFPGVDLVLACPWDSEKKISDFLKFYKPRIVLFARTDVWPTLAFQLKMNKIPCALFSATFSENSTRKRILASSLTRTALNSLNRIFCVSQVDAENLEDLGVKVPLEISGDTRFDQVLFRIENPNPFKNSLFSSDSSKPIFVCGSTWPQDEEVLIPTFQHWLSLGGKVVLAPHEVSIERIHRLTENLKKSKLPYIKYSESESWPGSEILILDQVGCLQEVYGQSHLAFVGGSFKDKVHSVMEPLCVGMQVLVGPYHYNNREAIQFQYLILGPGLFAVQVVQNSEEIKNVMTAQISHFETTQLKILNRVSQCSGATERLSSWVRECIKS